MQNVLATRSFYPCLNISKINLTLKKYFVIDFHTNTVLCGAVAAPIQNGGQFAQKSFLQPDEKESEEGGFPTATCIKGREFTYINKIEKMLDDLPTVREKIEPGVCYPLHLYLKGWQKQKQNLK